MVFYLAIISCMLGMKKWLLFIYLLSAICFFLCVLSMFGPLLIVTTQAGESVAFFGWIVIFGGKADYVFPSGTYSFSFAMSVYLLVMSQCFLLSGISCLLGKRSRFNRLASILLAVAGIGMSCFYKLGVCEANGLPADGVSYGGALPLILTLGIIGIVLEIIYGIFATPNPAKTAPISKKRG